MTERDNAYAIEAIGFYDKLGNPFHDDGYRYDDYLPGYADAVFADQNAAAAFIAAERKGPDCDGIVAEFQVVRRA